MDVELYDSTLREGARREGIAFSIEDKLKILGKLEDLGVHYVDAGAAGGRGREDEFFRRAAGRARRRAEVVAWGTAADPRLPAAHDPGLRAILDAKTAIVAVSFPVWDRAVGDRTAADNRAQIGAAVGYLRAAGRRVFFAADHAFDGLQANPAYALECLRAAVAAGAERVILSDTNGGSLPTRVAAGVGRVAAAIDRPVGIHGRNDGDLAVANAIAAVEAGASIVQGTVNGYGDRCGAANLISILANLQLKLGRRIVADDQLARLAEVAHFVSEIANLIPDNHQPFVGVSAFAQRVGRTGPVRRDDPSLQHIDPALVGNYRRIVVSDLADRGPVVYRSAGAAIPGDQARGILDRMQSLADQGFQFDGAEASLELLLRRTQPGYRPPFVLVDYLVIVEKRRRGSGNGHPDTDDLLAEATVKVRVGDELVHTVAEGNGPVNALDRAVRKALTQFYPSLAATRLLDYKVRVLDETDGTAAHVRVLIESTDGDRRWTTVGTHGNIIEASWQALTDSLEYWLTAIDTAAKS